MKSKELCAFLEKLRSSRNLSQENFTANIVSLRQYRRYLNGESDIPFQIIQQLTAKIGVKVDNLLREFHIAKVEETELINKMFNLVVNYDHKEFILLSQKKPIEEIIDKSNELMYKHCILLNYFFTGKISPSEALSRNSRLIDYPNILDSPVITSVEMLILTFLLDLAKSSSHEKILIKVTNIIDHPTTVFSGANEKITIFSIVRIAKFFGIHDDYDNVIKYCALGIKKSLSLRTYFLLDYLFYYSSLAYHRQENTKEYEKMLVKCFNVLHAEGNVKKIAKFTKLIEEDFNIVLKDFISDYYRRETEKDLSVENKES